MLGSPKGPVPLFFGMDWADQGVHGRYGHHLRLCTAEGSGYAFSDAYKAEREAMISAGFSWHREGGRLVPCFWELPEPVWTPAVEGRITQAILAAAEEREAAAQRQADREAEELARVAKTSAPIRRDLVELLAERPWAFGKAHAEAEEMADLEEWTAYGAAWAGRLVDNALRAIQRAEERLAREPAGHWYKHAADPDVRDTVLAAWRILSERDSDRASIRNGRGWSQSTSWTGHVLSGRESLTQAEAAHGMAILWGHRIRCQPTCAMRPSSAQLSPLLLCIRKATIEASQQEGHLSMFQMIVANLTQGLVRALRSIGRALKRLAKRTVDPVTGTVRWAVDRTLDAAHDVIDLAEHAAAVPGAALAGLLGHRPTDPGDLADMAVAADRAQQAAPAEPRASLCVGEPVHDEAIEAFAALRDETHSALLYQLRDEVAYWAVGLLDDERAIAAKATLPTLRAHIEGTALIPGVPPILTRAQVLATRQASKDFDRLVNSDPDLLAEMHKGALAAANRNEEQSRAPRRARAPEPEPALAGFRM